jgi:transposase
MRIAPSVELSSSDRLYLESFARARSRAAHRVVERARMILMAAEGRTNLEIGQHLHIDPRTVARWRSRVIDHGVGTIERDAPRPGRTPAIAPEVISAVLRMTTQERPPHATEWSSRTLAKQMGLSPSTIRRIWQRHGLKPHLIRTFKLSNDPDFEAKLTDIIGLYVHPPEHALVLSADEKSQIQALDRTQPGLPLKPGRARTMTHDYKRNGTTTLFAALNTLDGSVATATCMPKHRHQEWLKFLKLIDQTTDPDRDIHLIVDNYATHKHATVRAWLARHPRFHLHFTPTGASWLNMVERLFRDLTCKRIRRGAFTSVHELENAILDYLEHHNRQPKPFIWTAAASDILEKVKRARAAKINYTSV